MISASFSLFLAALATLVDFSPSSENVLVVFFLRLSRVNNVNAVNAKYALIKVQAGTVDVHKAIVIKTYQPDWALGVCVTTRKHLFCGVTAWYRLADLSL